MILQSFEYNHFSCITRYAHRNVDIRSIQTNGHCISKNLLVKNRKKFQWLLRLKQSIDITNVKQWKTYVSFKYLITLFLILFRL